MDMITASAADAHRFGRVRRNGYDPAEVDAVVARLVEALAAQEQQTAQLEKRLSEADASADAIRRTFIAAEQTRGQILDVANAEAAQMRERAQRESEEAIAAAHAVAASMTADAEARAAQLNTSSDELDRDIAQRRAHLLARAHEEADRVRTDAETSAAERTAEALEAADRIITTAHADAAEHVREAALMARSASIAAGWTRREALTTAESIIADARDRSARIIAEAERGSEAARERSMRLQAAIASLEASARAIAESSPGSVSVIDLSAIEAREREDAVVAPIEPVQGEPASELPVEGGATVDAEDSPTAGESAPEPASGLLTVAEATAELTDEEPHGDTGAPRAGRTYYQRTSGVPLSERVKIAKKSG
jgi:DivIVA domain-containing protein